MATRTSRSAALATLLTGALAGTLAATGCFGAVSGGTLGTQDGGRDPAERPQEPSGAHPEPGQHTDKSIRLELEPVRAPAGLGERALARAETIVGFGPRYASKEQGQAGWTRQLSYIEAELEALGLTVERDTWTDRKELITFTNLAARIPGKRKERIVLACHHDTKCTRDHPEPQHNFEFVGANDGASAVALLLELAPVLQHGEPEATIELVFLDGEESLDWAWNDAARALFGSKRYVTRQRDAEVLGTAAPIRAAIVLDMVGSKYLHIQDELYSTARLRTVLWSAAVACGHEHRFFQRAEGAADDHVPFLSVGIPAVDLIDLNGNATWHTPADTLENLSAESLQTVADVVLTMLPAVAEEYVVKAH
ncbi:MAG: Zn-dependent exopeptidase M28 [Planctomycetes bacterium]|nr:Zn-dependent exopeptidase M28 [Planctomycetota bacterium]